MEKNITAAMGKAAENTLQQLFDCRVQKILQKPITADQQHLDEFSCFIGFTGSYNGLFVLKCSKQTALKNGACMLGGEVSAAEALDAAGEILNIITGAVKKYLHKEQNPFTITPPALISGRESTIRVPRIETYSIISYKFNIALSGNVYIELFYK
ncbi:MAG TPA: chemotaxis protein CheX [Spirochaetota bacterium]|nr:chemotaxis protein CheX [Spirochaetota bacterium]